MERREPLRVVVMHPGTEEWTSIVEWLSAEPSIRIVCDLRHDLNGRLDRLREQIDVLLVDVSVVQAFGEAAAARFISATGTSRTLVVAPEKSVDMAILAARIGAVGLLAASSPRSLILKAINCVSAGEVWFDRRSIAKVFSAIMPPIPVSTALDEETHEQSPTSSPLSKREREVVALLSEGLRNKQIADRLFISEITVRHHLTSIFNKVGVGDRKSLILYSYRTGLARRPSHSRASRTS